jgi:predicted PurR-regulated permease PerM
MAIDNRLSNLVVFAVALAVAFVLLRPFFSAIVFAAVAAFLFHPTQNFLKKKIGDLASALLITTFVLGLLIAIVAFGVQIILREFGGVFLLISQADFTQIFPANPELAANFKDLTRFIVQKIIENFTAFVTQIPKLLLSFFIFLTATFFFLRDGTKLYKWILNVMPMRTELKTAIFSDVQKYAHAFIYVWLLIGIVQAIVAAVGFVLFKQPYPLLAGLAAFILSVLPMLGVYILYLVAGGILILQGDVNNGVGLILYGMALGSFFDYVVRPYYAGKWAAVHPLIILLGIFGGIFVLGPAGIIVGPVILLIIAAILHGASIIKAKKK